MSVPEGSYYPKLQVSVPFTPATGPRLLVKPGIPQTGRNRLWPLAWLRCASGGGRLRGTSPSLPKPDW